MGKVWRDNCVSKDRSHRTDGSDEAGLAPWCGETRRSLDANERGRDRWVYRGLAIAVRLNLYLTCLHAQNVLGSKGSFPGVGTKVQIGKGHEGRRKKQKMNKARRRGRLVGGAIRIDAV
jgi:hypothetical protein